MKKLLPLLLFLHLGTSHADDIYINFIFFNINKGIIRILDEPLPQDPSLQDFGTLIEKLIKRVGYIPYFKSEKPDICIACEDELFLIQKHEQEKKLFNHKIGKWIISRNSICVFPKSLFFERYEFQIPELNIDNATPEEIAVIGKKVLLPLKERSIKTPMMQQEIIINGQEIPQEVWNNIKQYYNTLSDEHFLLINNHEKIPIAGLRVFGGHKQTKETIIKSISAKTGSQNDSAVQMWINQKPEHLSLLRNNILFKYSNLLESNEISIDEDSELIFYSILREEPIGNFILRIVTIRDRLQNLNSYDHHRINLALSYIINYSKAYMVEGTPKKNLIKFLKKKCFPTFELKVRVHVPANREQTLLFRLILPQAMTFDQAVAAATKYLIDQDFDMSDCDPKIVDMMGNDGEGDINTILQNPNIYLEFRPKDPAEVAP